MNVAALLDRVIAAHDEARAYSEMTQELLRARGGPVKVHVDLSARAYWSDTVTLTDEESAEYLAAQPDERESVLVSIVMAHHDRGDFDIMDATDSEITVEFSREVQP